MAIHFIRRWRMPISAAGMLAILLLAAGCRPLKEVNAFALASQAMMDKAAAFDGYGRVDFCFDSMLVYNNTGEHLRDYDVDTVQAHAEDSILQHAYRIMSAYFGALAKLADSKTVLKTTTLSNAVSAGTYGSITITSTEAGIFNGLMTAAQDVLTDRYKSKKIEDILERYHDSVNLAIGSLMKLTKIRELRIIIMAGVFASGNMETLVEKADTALKLTLVALYQEKNIKWRQAWTDDERRYQGLAKIQAGHDSLYLGEKNLKDEQFKKKMLDFAGNIIYLSQ